MNAPALWSNLGLNGRVLVVACGDVERWRGGDGGSELNTP